jgi:hypothetical protein
MILGSPKTFLVAVTAVVVAAAAPAPARAPQSDKLEENLPSMTARVGLVNSVQGQLSLRDRDGESRVLIEGDALAKGEIARTGASSYAEILLRPGAYLRVWENTEFAFLDTSPDNLKIWLPSGSAIIEAWVSVWHYQGPVFTLLTPHAELLLMGGGLYRANISAGDAELFVYKGKALGGGALVKKEQGLSVRSGATSLKPAGRPDHDAFGSWSQTRALFLVRANKRIPRRIGYQGVAPLSPSESKSSSGDSGIAVADRLKYSVSTQAGTVNLAEFGSLYQSRGPVWKPVTEGIELRRGDVVQTDAASRVEVLLGPGYYLRADASTEFILVETAIDKLKLSLVKGSAIIEGWADGHDDRPITVAAAGAEIRITEEGIYRLNATAARFDILVRKGGARLGNVAITEGQQGVISNGNIQIRQVSSQRTDSFEAWSNTLPRGIIGPGRTILKHPIRRRWSPGRHPDLWIFDPVRGCHIFMPARDGYSSPYGQGYSVYNGRSRFGLFG